jgi:hypothetical protein
MGFLLALVGCIGCFGSAPVFLGISEISLVQQGSRGTEKKLLEGDALAEATDCLMSSQEIPQSQLSSELLPEIILLSVKDRLGDRMFELTTNENFSGNKGKYYYNACIYRIVKSL